MKNTISELKTSVLKNIFGGGTCTCQYFQFEVSTTSYGADGRIRSKHRSVPAAWISSGTFSAPNVEACGIKGCCERRCMTNKRGYIWEKVHYDCI